jgi:hypothetical protein
MGQPAFVRRLRHVYEVNVAPVLGAIGNMTTDELVLLNFTATATDADLPANTLTFTLADGAEGQVPTARALIPSLACLRGHQPKLKVRNLHL